MQETGYSLRIGNQHNTHEEQPHWKLGTGNWEPPTGKPFSKSRLRLRLRSRYRFRYSGWQPGTGNWELPNGERFLPKPIATAIAITIPIGNWEFPNWERFLPKPIAIATAIAIPIPIPIFRLATGNWKLGIPQRGTLSPKADCDCDCDCDTDIDIPTGNPELEAGNSATGNG